MIIDLPGVPDPNKWKEAIEQMINSHAWPWAEDFLLSVYDQIEKRGRISEKQVESLRKIRDKRIRKAGELGIENL